MKPDNHNRHANMKRGKLIGALLLKEELLPSKECWERENLSFPSMSSLIGCLVSSGQSWTYIHTNNTNEINRFLGYIYVFMCSYVYCIYVTKIIKEKRCHTYEKEGAWEDLGRKTEQDIDVILFSF